MNLNAPTSCERLQEFVRTPSHHAAAARDGGLCALAVRGATLGLVEEAQQLRLHGRRARLWRIRVGRLHKELVENNRMGKTRDLFKKIRDTKGTFHAKMGTIKDRNEW